MAPKEVSLCSRGLNGASLYRGLVQGQSECINVGFGEVLDLREASKGEEVTVVVIFIASAIVSPFQGLVKR